MRACCCRKTLLRCAEAGSRTHGRRRPLTRGLFLRLELQPVAEIAPDQLLEALDLALQVPAYLFLNTHRQRLASGRNPVPLQHALAEGEDRIERAAVGEVAIELALAAPIVRPGHIFADRFRRALEQPLETRQADVMALAPRSEIDRSLHR